MIFYKMNYLLNLNNFINLFFLFYTFFLYYNHYFFKMGQQEYHIHIISSYFFIIHFFKINTPIVIFNLKSLYFIGYIYEKKFYNQI